MADLIDKLTGGDDTGADEEVDPELREMAGQRPEGSVLRPVIFVAVVALGVWIYADWRPELQYFWSAWEPAELGDMTTEFPHDKVTPPTGDPDADESGVLPHNRYVHLRGITEPGIQPEGGGYTFFMLRGAPVFVMVPQGKQKAGGNELLQEARKMTLADLQDAGQSRPIDMTGRLIDLSRMPNRFKGLKQFFGKKFGIEFCSMYSDAELRRRWQRRREVVRARLRMEYEEATPEERKAEDLSAEPSEARVSEAMKDEKICMQAYLLRGGHPPWRFWWYLAAIGLYGAFMLLNVWWLVQWVRRFAARSRPQS